jgi:hypothetical protein
LILDVGRDETATLFSEIARSIKQYRDKYDINTPQCGLWKERPCHFNDLRITQGNCPLRTPTGC